VTPKLDDVIAYLQSVREQHGNIDVELDKDGWMESDFPQDTPAVQMVADRGVFHLFTHNGDTTLFINN
jgi:hypothetical protein